jgi:hypothetical protein
MQSFWDSFFYVTNRITPARALTRFCGWIADCQWPPLKNFLIRSFIKYKRRKRNGTFDYNRFYQMKSRYGILENEYNELLIKQNNLCCICKQPNKKLCVDHNHDNKKIRGLLCRDCNSGLGMFKDNREYLLEAIKYLLKGVQ